MTKNNGLAWNTKHGPRRIRDEAPTLEEAISAAQGLSDELDEQAEIAASLMGLPHDQVRAELLKAARPRRDFIKSVVSAGTDDAPRKIVVERKRTRRIIDDGEQSKLGSSSA